MAQGGTQLGLTNLTWCGVSGAAGEPDEIELDMVACAPVSIRVEAGNSIGRRQGR
jgi:hypothetical protein